MRWQDKAAELKLDKGVSWKNLPEELEKIYKRPFTYDQARNAVRRHPRYKQRNQSIEDIHSIILDALKKKHDIESLTDKTGATPRLVKAAIEDLRDEGYLIDEFDGFYKLNRNIVPKENKVEEDWQGNKIIRFGVVSDTHLCSKWQQLTHLNTMYDIFEKEGIETVYHTGDLTEGVNMRRGHEYEVFKHGVDAQTDYVIKNYPKRKGIVTKFITGNHDHSGIKAAGHDIGYPIQNARDDMIYLGMSNAKINLTPNCVLEINHPLDGAAYALSYALQKRIDAMSGGEKPNILFDGHHHKAIYLFYRNIHGYEAGTFQAQTSWMRGKRLPAHMGGWIIEIHVDDEGSIRSCTSTFYPFYKAIENDY